MAAGSIVIDLLMKTGSFETDTKRAEKRLQELKKEAAKVGSAIGVAFAGFAAASALLVKGSIDAADKMSDLAQSTGLTVESISALTYAADFGGVSQEALASSMVKLSKSMSDAAQGTGDAVKGFDALGISVENADGSLKGSDQVLSEIATKFAGFKDGAEKTALAVNLFGKSGAELIPMLNLGAAGIEELKDEALKLGLVLSTDTANAAGDFNDTLARLTAVGKGLTNQIAAELLPVLQSMASGLLDSTKGSEALSNAARIAATGVKLLVSAGVIIGGVFKTLGTVLGGVAATLVQLFSGNFKQAFDIAKNTVTDFAGNIKGTIGTVGAIWDNEASKIAGSASSNAEKIAAPVIKATEKVARAAKAIKDETQKIFEEIEKQITGIRREIATFGQSETQVKLFDLQASGATPEQIERANQLLQTLDELNRVQEVGVNIANARADAEKEIAAVFEATRTPLERFNAELIRLSDLRDQGLDWETYARGVEMAQKAFEDAGAALDDFSKNAAENIQRSLGDELVNILDGDFKNLGDSFVKMLNRMVAEALAADLARKMFGAASGGEGEGWFGSALNWIGDNLGFVGAKAGGGDVMGNSSYLVGEDGPEMFVPRTAGTIVPNGALAGGGSKSSVTNVYVTPPAGSSRQTALQWGETASRQIAYAGRKNG